MITAKGPASSAVLGWLETGVAKPELFSVWKLTVINCHIFAAKCLIVLETDQIGTVSIKKNY